MNTKTKVLEAELQELKKQKAQRVEQANRTIGHGKSYRLQQSIDYIDREIAKVEQLLKVTGAKSKLKCSECRYFCQADCRKNGGTARAKLPIEDTDARLCWVSKGYWRAKYTRKPASPNLNRQ